MSFWDIVWFIFISFAFVAYLMVVFSIITDLFRDEDTSGWAKAAWIVCLVIFPLVTSLVYLVARGRHMTERANQHAARLQEAQDQHIARVAGTSTKSPTDQIADARAMLDAGVISQSEFERLKEKALV
jgi:Phospholipase_D-nuclease N-terminal/Short C-terminal domain